VQKVDIGLYVALLPAKLLTYWGRLLNVINKHTVALLLNICWQNSKID